MSTVSRSAGSSIGIFDSGVGGLTVAHAIHQALPYENLLYYGDTIHMPYGDKSPATIQSYCDGITRFLVKSECKAIVIACNTASSFGYDVVKEIAGAGIPVINVIDPVVKYVAAHYPGKKVGVIGTRGTIGSNVYQRKINQLESSVIVQSLATPLLAPMVEEGFTANRIAEATVEHYLTNPTLNGIDALILACTHYPMIKDEIRKVGKDQFEVIDSAEIVAAYTRDVIDGSGIGNGNKEKGKHHFFVSDLTPSFQYTASLFFRESIQLSHYNIWNNY